MDSETRLHALDYQYPPTFAEGLERSTPADQCKFLDYARGSCGEVRTQMIVGNTVGFLAQSTSEAWIKETRELSAMIQGLIRSIRTRSAN